MGNTKKSLNKKDEAIYHYKKAISLKNENIAALINLSSILKENNNYDDIYVSNYHLKNNLYLLD